MLIDDVTIIIRGGDGGNGKLSFRRTGQTPRGGPDGGNGGKGGDVYLRGVSNIDALSQFRFKKKVSAENGIDGGSNNKFGRAGKDVTLLLPIGTQVTDTESGKSWEIIDTTRTLLIARGGAGGRGNNEFKTAIDQAPYYAEKGERGEEKTLHLTLKLIADIGLIGLPNAGKSTLLAMLTNAQPKIADYPFTTLEPNLGVLMGFVLADIPGLIEGAHAGKGLGDKFLRHIEKTKVLLHCIDSSGKDVMHAYQTVRHELASYSSALEQKDEIILLTKIDMIEKSELEQKQKALLTLQKPVLCVSAYDDLTMDALGKHIKETLT